LAVRGQVDADQLRTAGRGRAELDAAGVHKPEPIEGIDHDALHRDQVVDVFGCVGVGDGLALLDLGDGAVDFIAPFREIDKDPSGTRDGHAGGHRPVEGRDNLEPASGAVFRHVDIVCSGVSGRSDSRRQQEGAGACGKRDTFHFRTLLARNNAIGHAPRG
jgi:hypothetical protein